MILAVGKALIGVYRRTVREVKAIYGGMARASSLDGAELVCGVLTAKRGEGLVKVRGRQSRKFNNPAAVGMSETQSYGMKHLPVRGH